MPAEVEDTLNIPLVPLVQRTRVVEAAVDGIVVMKIPEQQAAPELSSSDIESTPVLAAGGWACMLQVGGTVLRE